MPNDFYNHSTYPVAGSAGSSALLRAELDSISAGFDKLPGLTGNANKLVVINGSATGLTVASSLSGITLSSSTLSSNTITGGTINNTVIGGTTPAAGAFTTLTANGNTVATQAGAETLTNKTFNLANNTFVATSAQLAAAITDESGSGALLFANSPALTGTPTAPTAAAGTGTTQIATTAFVASTAFNTNLPAQAGNAGKFVTTDGSNASWAAIPGQNGATASGSVTLTASSAGAQSITPTTWGQSVTLPDATTCTLGAQLFSIRNAGDYELKILDSTGVCLGFIRPLTTVDVGLANKATAAGTWVLNGEEVIGITATTSVATGYSTYTGGSAAAASYIALDSDRDCLLYCSTGQNDLYGIVYNKTTRTWGSATLIRSGIYAYNFEGIKTATDQVLVASCNNGTAFQAVVLSISGTTITVNTAATATLPAAPVGLFNSNTVGRSSMVLVGSSVVLSYATSGAAAPVIRAMTISGTTVTIGSETALPGSYLSETCPLYVVSSSVVLTLSQTTPVGTLSARCFTVSGTTLTGGSTATLTLSAFSYKVSSLGSAWALVYQNSQVYGAILTVSGTTPTFSTALVCSSSNSPTSYFGTSKVTVAADNGSGSVLVNTFGNNAGAISAGTQTTSGIGGTISGIGYWLSGATTVGMRISMSTSTWLYSIDISGTNPSVTRLTQIPSGLGGDGIQYKTGFLILNPISAPSGATNCWYQVWSSTGLQRQGTAPAPGTAAGMVRNTSADYYQFNVQAGSNPNGGVVIQRVEIAQ